MKRALSTLFIGIISLFFCNCNKNKSVLAINAFKPIVWQIMNADYLYQQTSNQDTLNDKQTSRCQYYQRIFNEHNTTKEQFYFTYHYYQMHPLEMRVLIDSVEAYGNREKAKFFSNNLKIEKKSPVPTPVK